MLVSTYVLVYFWVMVDKTKSGIQAWIAEDNVAQFQQKLNSETDEFRYKILVQLLEDELHRCELETCISATSAPHCCLPLLDQRNDIANVPEAV